MKSKDTTGQGPATDDKTLEAELAAAPADPTRDEAKAMFKENPGLAHVLTDTGWMSRDEC